MKGARRHFNKRRSANGPLKVKVIFGDDSRIMPNEVSHEFKLLHTAAYDAFDIESVGGDKVFCLAYTDEAKNEHVGIYSQDDLDEALGVANAEKRKNLKVYIVPTTKASPPKNVAVEQKEEKVIIVPTPDELQQQPGAPTPKARLLSKNASSSSVRDPKQQREGSPPNKIEVNRQNSLRRVDDDGAAPKAAPAADKAVAAKARNRMDFFDALKSPSFHSEVVAAKKEAEEGNEGVPYTESESSSEKKEAPKAKTEPKMKAKFSVVSEAALRKMKDLKGLKFDKIPSTLRSRFTKSKESKDVSEADVKSKASSVAGKPPSSIPSMHSRQPSSHGPIKPHHARSPSRKVANSQQEQKVPEQKQQQPNQQQQQQQQQQKEQQRRKQQQQALSPQQIQYQEILQAAARAQQEIALEHQRQFATLQQQEAAISQQQILTRQQLKQLAAQEEHLKQEYQHQRYIQSNKAANETMKQRQTVANLNQGLLQKQQQLAIQQQQVQQQKAAIREQQANPLTQEQLVQVIQQQKQQKQQQQQLQAQKLAAQEKQRKSQSKSRSQQQQQQQQPGAAASSQQQQQPPQAEAKAPEKPKHKLTHRESALLDAIKNDDAEIATAIIKKGVNVNCEDEDGDSPLSLSVQKEMAELFVVLLTHDPPADYNHANKNGFTPLHFAAGRGYIDFVSVLLALKPPARVFKKTKTGKHALDYSAPYDEVCATIKAHIAEHKLEPTEDDEWEKRAAVVTGACACGGANGVKYELLAPPKHFHHCYCSRCRKASGSASATWVPMRKTDIRWTQDKAIKKVKTSEDAERWHCTGCGAQVVLNKFRHAEYVWLAAGLFDDLPSKILSSIAVAHTHVLSAPEWHLVPGDGNERYEHGFKKSKPV